MAINSSVPSIGGKAANGIFVDMSIDGPDIGTLVVIIDRAKNLPSRRSMGKQDPYCAIRFGKEVRKTETDKRGGQTPRWEQEFKYIVHDSPDYFKIKLSVFNDDKKTELIGEAWLNLIDIIVPGGGQLETWQALQCKSKYAGEVRLEIRYDDTRSLEQANLSAENVAPGTSTEAARREYPSMRRRPIVADNNFNRSEPDLQSVRRPQQQTQQQYHYQAYSPQRTHTNAGYRDSYGDNTQPHDEFQSDQYNDHGQPEFDAPYSRSPGHVSNFHQSDSQQGYYPDEREYQRNQQHQLDAQPYASPDRSYIDRHHGQEQQYHSNRPSPSDRSPIDGFEPRHIQRSETMPAYGSQPQHHHDHYENYDQFSDYPSLPPTNRHNQQPRYHEDQSRRSVPLPPSHRRTYTSGGTHDQTNPSQHIQQSSHSGNHSPAQDQYYDQYDDPSGPDHRAHTRRHTVMDGSRVDGYRDGPQARRNMPMQDPALALPQLPPTGVRHYRRPYDPQQQSLSTPPSSEPTNGSIKYKRLPPRKSIATGISAAPFSPDSFDAYNPNSRQPVLPRTADNRHSPSPMRTIRERQNDEPPQIITLSGAVVDPTDLLPIDTWAPEPEKASPTKISHSHLPERERPIGARDPRTSRWNGSGGGVAVPGPHPSPLPPLGNASSPYGSVGRVRGMGQPRTGPSTPLAERHGGGDGYNTANSRPNSSRGYVSDYGPGPSLAQQHHGGGMHGGGGNSHKADPPDDMYYQKQYNNNNNSRVGDRGSGHGLGPGGPPGGGPGGPGGLYGDDLHALSAEMQMIDIGSGSTRRRLRGSESTYY